MTRFKSFAPSALHQRCRDAMIASIRKEAADMSAADILAIAAYTVGQLIALQDQRTMTPDQAMELVAKNIEAGNAHALAEVASVKTDKPQ